jgi:putative protease
MRVPDLLSPVTSYEGAKAVIAAGADEIYCAVKIPGAIHLLNRPGLCCVSTYDELGRIVVHARSTGVQTIVTLELPFLSDFLMEQMKAHISACVSQGIDAIIAGDIGLITLMRDMGIDIPIYASTLLGAMNYEAACFIRDLGVRRVILERHVNISEVAEIVQGAEDVEIEVFVHGGGCSNINANCYLRFAFPSREALAGTLQGFVIKGRVTPCRLPFRVREFGTQEELARTPLLDAYSLCSLCDLPDLVDTGVSGLKIVGRCMTLGYQVQTTRMYRGMLDLMEQSRRRKLNRAQRRRLQRVIQSLQGAPSNEHLRHPGHSEQSPLDATPMTLTEIACAEGRCYYAPFLHTPCGVLDGELQDLIG